MVTWTMFFIVSALVGAAVETRERATTAEQTLKGFMFVTPH
jgi:hypothetical protein